MSIKLAINGFGRIGRLVARTALRRDDMELVAVNDLGDIEATAHLLKYDSIHGTWREDIQVVGDSLKVGSKSFKVLCERNPENLPWRELGVDYVIEASGAFRTRDKAALHLQAGAKKVIITAPGKKVDFTAVMGVNEENYDPAQHHIISNASCTTNCLAPVAKVLMQEFGIVRGVMTTIHSFTNDQKVLDMAHSDLRRARTASMSLIPTTTGAASAVGEVLPELKGKLDGLAIRVPTPNVSLVDLTVELQKNTTAEEINAAFRKAADGELKGVLKYTEEELVSRDYNGEEHSAVVDAPLTMVMDGNLAKVIAWYDNEWGYSVRVVDLLAYLASKA
ncbi:MAG: type I glyceraldehyde-3-phosphate dehydrogenase [Syntrophomonadaceae bacterium]|nr:type I glyceraldehyde-3-phosphate dehydrogenase [Syntrophomonadaceae bacterium]